MRRRLLALLLAISLLTGSAGAVLSVEDARMLVEKVYIDQVPEEVLSRDTVEGIFAGLDQYSSYLPAKNYDDFMGTINEVPIIGLGILYSFAEDGQSLEILQVYEGGAAHRGGMVAGDRILSVDGTAVDPAESLDEIAARMQGEQGTQIVLEVLRSDGSREALSLTRAPFTIPYTQYSLTEGHIGYLDCNSIGAETYGHFTDALDELGDQVTHWVLDLRDNVGGLTAEAAQVSGVFTGRGVKTLLRQKGDEYYAFPATGERTTMYPVLVLVNEATASAAEQLASVIRDQTAGIVIGSRTFGKGVAQTIVDKSVEPEIFIDGDAVRITSGRFYSPSGLTNDKIGVLPHLLVEEPYVEGAAYLLCTASDRLDNENVMGVQLGAWNFYVDLTVALEEEQGLWRPDFVALLEGLWPGAPVSLGMGEGAWEQMTVDELARRLDLTEYSRETFADGGASDYEYALNVLGHYGMLRGDGAGNCAPREELTRAQLCAMLAQTLDYHGAGESRFSDVPADAWYAPAVNAMAELGLIQGDGAGQFHPEDTLTQEQMIAVLSRLACWLSAGLYEQHKQGVQEGAVEQAGLETYNAWAREGAWLLGLSQTDLFGNVTELLWTGVDDLQPQATAHRDEAAFSIYRILTETGLLCD